MFRYQRGSITILSEILGELCKSIHEQSGKPVASELKSELADRIALCASRGETDPARLKAFALAILPGHEDRPSLPN